MLPTTMAAECLGLGLGLRAFGTQAADLSHDFGGDDRPGLVTDLLAGCSVDGDGASDGSLAAMQQHWWQAAVGARTTALLALMALSDVAGARALPVALRCGQPDCRARFDVDVPAAAWAGAYDDPAPVHVQREGAEPLSLRRPTGADLRACRTLALQLALQQDASHADPAQIAQALLQRLCLSGTPRAADAGPAAAALADADPLVDFAVHCACPECGSVADRPIDLEAEALRRLAACQRALLQQVHLLASHYGWTEQAIFAVPAQRRALYLQAIGAAAVDRIDRIDLLDLAR